MADAEIVVGDGSAHDDAKSSDLTPPEDVGSKAPPRKRRRIVISCTECHRRKQRCDRKMPCTNCTSRGKQASCRYETGTPLKDGRKSAVRSSRDRTPEVESMPLKAADFGYSHNGAQTLGFLRKIEGAGAPITTIAQEAQEADHVGSRERYKSLIRHLPARMFVNKLVDIYFKDFNWQYFGVDEPLFRDHLEKWYALPFNVLSTTGPQGIDPVLRSYPALLFQVIATSLLAIYDESDETFASLKYAGNMTFEDLAMDYSETGCALLTLLGKRQMTITTVLAGWVRAAFLKYTGQVTEAWHQVGTAIRDAQEIGLHRDDFDPQPDPNDSESMLENMWMAQSRRRIWITLACWDLHTGAVLGRPTSVDYRTLKRSVPIDAPIPKDPRKTPIFPRGEDDPPTPLTRAVWAFECMKPLRDILDLEKEGPFPKDFSKVEKIHQQLLELKERTPPFFRTENPDTRFDNLPECWWLPHVRPTLPQLISFDFMALHRPYIFTREASRHEALKASLDMLAEQRVHFASLAPQQYKTFSLFFGTFDAVVMMASIFILFPKEHRELLDSALQHFRWSVERFQTMANRNRLAGAALGVLNAIYIRFKKAVGLKCCGPCIEGTLGRLADEKSTSSSNSHSSKSVSSSSKSALGSADSTQTPMSDISAAHNPSLVSSCPPTSSEARLNGMGPGMSPAAASALFAPPTTDWSFPPNFDFGSLPPMYPMGDVAYNDLTGVRNDGFPGAPDPNAWSRPPPMSDVATSAGLVSQVGTAPDLEVPWQFGGDFGNDTIWNLLNQFPSY